MSLSPKTHVLNLVVLAFLFTCIDSLYLYLVSHYFNRQILTIQGSALKLDLLATFACYLVLVGSLYYFIILEKQTVWEAMLLGWSIYLVYEFTNKAIFAKWRWDTVLMDGVWGGLLFGITTWLYYQLRYIGKKIKNKIK